MATRHSFDLIVAGCGIAGLSAAVAAAERGARVAVLERAPMEDRGGQSRYTEAYLRMKSHREVSDDFETHFAENGCGSLDPDLIEQSAESQPRGMVRALSLTDPTLLKPSLRTRGPQCHGSPGSAPGSTSCPPSSSPNRNRDSCRWAAGRRWSTY